MRRILYSSIVCKMYCSRICLSFFPLQLAHASPFVEGRIVVIDGPAVVKRLEDLRAFWQLNQHPSLFLDIA